MLKEGISI